MHNFNLYQLNTCQLQAQQLIPRRFGLDRFQYAVVFPQINEILFS
jgi:hypothetical protein